jgi:hypothetical protein
MEIRCGTVAQSLVRAAQVSLASFLICASAAASPVTYEGYLVTDVSLAGKFYHSAEVTISFKGDTKDVHTLLQFPVQSDSTNTQNGGAAFIDRGEATIRIVVKGQQIRSRLFPHQLVVEYDSATGGVGFGALIGPNGFEPAYPLGLSNGVVDRPSNPVLALVTPGTISGNAWSCIGFPPASNGQQCSDPTPYPLKTDRGDLVFFNPYRYHNTSGNLSGYSGTLNRGFFWITPGNAGD